MDFIEIKKVTSAQKQVLFICLFSSIECLSTLGNMPPCTTHFKTTKQKQNTHSLTAIQIYSHTHRQDSNASVAKLKYIYLKYAD